MDAVRYYLALVIVAFSPGMYLFWFSVHPFIGFWRKVGAEPTMAVHYILMIVIAVPVVLVRKTILSVDFGAQPVSMAAAAVLFVFVLYLRIQISKQLAPKTLSGFPELAPERYGRKLLTEGIYSRIRHPRYVQLLLAFLAYALFSNYLAVYVVFLVGVVWIFLVVPIEEKELGESFGEEYERYRERVPRFVPKWRADPGGPRNPIGGPTW